MRFPNSSARLRLLVVWAAAAFWSGGLATADTPFTPGVLVRDQYPWSFTRAAMTGAPRSVVVPLATNLHVVFVEILYGRAAADLRQEPGTVDPRAVGVGVHEVLR